MCDAEKPGSDIPLAGNGRNGTQDGEKGLWCRETYMKGALRNRDIDKWEMKIEARTTVLRNLGQRENDQQRHRSMANENLSKD